MAASPVGSSTVRTPPSISLMASSSANVVGVPFAPYENVRSPFARLACTALRVPMSR